MGLPSSHQRLRRNRARGTCRTTLRRTCRDVRVLVDYSQAAELDPGPELVVDVVLHMAIASLDAAVAESGFRPFLNGNGGAIGHRAEGLGQCSRGDGVVSGLARCDAK